MPSMAKSIGEPVTLMGGLLLLTAVLTLSIVGFNLYLLHQRVFNPISFALDVSLLSFPPPLQ